MPWTVSLSRQCVLPLPSQIQTLLQCHPLNNGREIYARFQPAVKLRRRNGLPDFYTLQIMSIAHDKFDDILVSALLIEQQRLSPAEGETKRTDTRKLFNFRAWQRSGH